MQPISTSKIQKINFIIIIVSTVILAFGIALLSSYVVNIIGNIKLVGIIGLISIIISLLFLSKLTNPKIKETLRIEGGVFFDPENKVKKSIIGYDFHRDMNRYLVAISNENKAYKVALLKMNEGSKKNYPYYNPDDLNYFSLSASCAEFIFLYKLSLHLNGYFIHEEIDRDNIEEIPRNKIEKEVFKNRVLDLITRDHQEREAFCHDKYNNVEGELCYAVGKNGEIFNHFNLELPKGSTLKRLDNDFLCIENNVFKLTFGVRCDGTNTVIDRELIIGDYDAPWLVDIKIVLILKRKILSAYNDIKLYQWLDSFLVSFYDYMDIDKLHERSNLQVMRILKAHKIN